MNEEWIIRLRILVLGREFDSSPIYVDKVKLK